MYDMKLKEPEALIGFQLKLLMLDFSLKVSIQIIKTKVHVPRLIQALQQKR